MVTFVSIGVYALVAVALLSYSRRTGGPWIGLVDFMLDLLFCGLWPLSLVMLAFCGLCDIFWGRDGGRGRK